MKLSDLQDNQRALIETIFSGFDGALVVDEEGTIIIFTEHYARESGLKKESVVGMKVQEIFPHTRMIEVITTGKPLIAEQWEFNNKTRIVSRFPVVSQGRIVGAVAVSVFRYLEEAHQFASRLASLTSELSFYKETVKKLSGAKYSLAKIIGKSEALVEAKDKVRQVAASMGPVIIYGETGTGKELFAHAIHQEGPRRDHPFVRVNCAGIPENLMESEFFGYEEGAFTGARKGGKPGKFELASKGSIFLDEINDLPYSLQPKLLRVLQEKEFERVGGTEVRSADARIISATNVDLRNLVQENRFRSDLFYRLNGFLIRIPPLRERPADIPILVEHFIAIQNAETGTSIEGVEPEAMKTLMAYNWPGNVRELEISIERACLDKQEGVIRLENLIRFGGRTVASQSRPGRIAESLKEAREAAEKRAIINALETSQGNKQKAADLLGIHRTSLYYKLKEYGLME